MHLGRVAAAAASSILIAILAKCFAMASVLANANLAKTRMKGDLALLRAIRNSIRSPAIPTPIRAVPEPLAPEPARPPEPAPMLRILASLPAQIQTPMLTPSAFALPPEEAQV
jgi:hypothetical protein